MSVQNRLQRYLALKSLGYKDFERLCGLGNGTAAKIGANSRETILDRISNACDLDTNWLITGEGEMIRPKATQNIEGDGNVQVAGNAHNVNAGKTIDELVSLLKKKDEQIDRLISLLEKKEQ